jgi:hypothetical protein
MIAISKNITAEFYDLQLCETSVTSSKDIVYLVSQKSSQILRVSRSSSDLGAPSAS